MKINLEKNPSTKTTEDGINLKESRDPFDILKVSPEKRAEAYALFLTGLNERTEGLAKDEVALIEKMERDFEKNEKLNPGSLGMEIVNLYNKYGLYKKYEPLINLKIGDFFERYKNIRKHKSLSKEALIEKFIGNKENLSKINIEDVHVRFTPFSIHFTFIESGPNHKLKSGSKDEYEKFDSSFELFMKTNHSKSSGVCFTSNGVDITVERTYTGLNPHSDTFVHEQQHKIFKRADQKLVERDTFELASEAIKDELFAQIKGGLKNPAQAYGIIQKHYKKLFKRLDQQEKDIILNDLKQAVGAIESLENQKYSRKEIIRLFGRQALKNFTKIKDRLLKTKK